MTSSIMSKMSTFWVKMAIFQNSFEGELNEVFQFCFDFMQGNTFLFNIVYGFLSTIIIELKITRQS